jgi:hypothetical protein
MSNEAAFVQAGIYLSLVSVVVFLESITIGKWWKRNEIARWIIGIATVIGLALPFVWMGALDWQTWQVFLLAFALAGGIKYFLFVHFQERERTRRAQELRRKVEEYAKDDNEQGDRIF